MKFARYVEHVVMAVTGEENPQKVDELASDLEEALTDAGHYFKSHQVVTGDDMALIIKIAQTVLKEEEVVC
jgi:hypothetical protein